MTESASTELSFGAADLLLPLLTLLSDPVPFLAARLVNRALLTPHSAFPAPFADMCNQAPCESSQSNLSYIAVGEPLVN